MKRLLLTTFTALFGLSAAGQDNWDPEKHLAGWNTISLLSGGANFFSKFEISDPFHLGVEAGYQYQPGITYKQLYDGVEEMQHRGAFLKLYPLAVWSIENAQLQAGPVYIASWYDESATFGDFNGPKTTTASGLAHGLALHLSADIFLGARWGFRLGVQQGFNFREDYVRDRNKTYQPGLGAIFIGPLPWHQGFAGVFLRW